MANRMPRRNEEWKRQTECHGRIRNGKDERNAEEECGIKKANRMPRRSNEVITNAEEEWYDFRVECWGGVDKSSRMPICTLFMFHHCK